MALSPRGQLARTFSVTFEGGGICPPSLLESGATAGPPEGSFFCLTLPVCRALRLLHGTAADGKDDARSERGGKRGHHSMTWTAPQMQGVRERGRALGKVDTWMWCARCGENSGREEQGTAGSARLADGSPPRRRDDHVLSGRTTSGSWPEEGRNRQALLQAKGRTYFIVWVLASRETVP